MAKSRLRLVAPSTVLRTAMPTRPPDRDLRTLEHLTEAVRERTSARDEASAPIALIASLRQSSAWRTLVRNLFLQFADETEIEAKQE
jgi:hypothetical protein